MTAIQKYSNMAMFLHWSMALLILGLFCLGWYMEDLPVGSEERSYFFKLHKSIGITVFFLLIIRVIWSILVKKPALPASLTDMQRKLATTVHHLLYLFMLLQPLSGYISSTFTKYKTSFWGLFSLPKLAKENKQWNEFFTEVHEISSMILLVLILLHLAGAFAFVYSNHENVLKRMLPGSKT